MKTSSTIRFKRGFASYLLVLSSGAVLTLLMLAAYRRAIASQVVQGQVQLRVDYSEKEEAILRSIVGNTSNAAISVMQGAGPVDGVNDWPAIFGNALGQANASSSINAVDAGLFNIPAGAINANTADNAAAPLAIAQVIQTIPRVGGTLVNSGTEVAGAVYPAIWLGGGVNRPLPPVLTTSAATSIASASFPIIQPLAIADQKFYGVHAGTYIVANPETGRPMPLPINRAIYSAPRESVAIFPKFNQLEYPDIEFRYAEPGDLFVAKRHWWTFSMDASQQDASNTSLARAAREFVLSIYEVPSQMPISSTGNMLMGTYANGSNWGGVGAYAVTSGKIFASGGRVAGGANLRGIATRKGLALGGVGTIDGQAVATIGFQAGDREAAEIAAPNTNSGISQASESGRSAFVPLSTGQAIYDRYFPAGAGVAPTPWQEYASPAQQAAIRLDIMGIVAGITTVRMSYLLLAGGRSAPIFYGLPPPAIAPIVGSPFQMIGPVAGHPQMLQINLANFPAFLDSLDDPPTPIRLALNEVGGIARATAAGTTTLPLAAAAGADLNNSLVINLDPGAVGIAPMAFPPTVAQPGIVLMNAASLAGTVPAPAGVGPTFNGFNRGFSLVTNMILYIDGSFNSAGAMPAEHRFTLDLEDDEEDPPDAANPLGRIRTDAAGLALPTVPPCNLFAPVKRHGLLAPGAPGAPTVELIGQVASTNAVGNSQPLQTVLAGGTVGGAGDVSNTAGVSINLNQIYHPGNLPPLNLMNWLVVLDEIER